MRFVILVFLSISVPNAETGLIFGYNPNADPANPATWTSNTYQNIASRFTVGASDVTVDQVRYYADGDGSVSSSVSIWSAISGSLDGFQPGSLVAGATASFTPNASSLGVPLDEQIINFASPVTLSANTNYYFVVDASNAGAVGSALTLSTAQSSQFTEFGNTFADPQNRLITQSGGTWSNYSSSSFLPYALGTSDGGGSPVPEPSSFVLLGLSVIGLVFHKGIRHFNTSNS